MERKPVAPPPRDSGHWPLSTQSTQPILRARATPGHGRSGTITSEPPDDWVVTNMAAAVRALESEESEESGSIIIDDGTPIEGVVAASPHAIDGPMTEGNFVAGEIDVPTPIPDREDSISVEVDFTAASSLLGQPEADPDTGGRTPPIERR